MLAKLLLVVAIASSVASFGARAAAAAAAAEPVKIRDAALPCHRLPTNVRPVRYDTHLRFESLDSDVYEGQVNITVEFYAPCKSKLCGLVEDHDSDQMTRGLRGVQCDTGGKSNQIVLHADESLDILDVSMTSDAMLAFIFGSDFKERKIVEVLRDRAKQMIAIKLKRSVAPRSFGKLSLKFRGRMSKNRRGVYVSNYKDDGGREHKTLVSQFQPTWARTVLPCFDEPRFKVPFAISLSHPSDLTAYGNTEIKSIVPDSGGANLVTTRFITTPKMPIHMVAFAVGQFDEPLEHDLEFKEHGETTLRKVRVITAPGKRETGAFALEVAAQALEWFEQLVDYQYPLDKLDILAIADLERDNSESWGLAMVRDTLLWIDDETKPDARITTAVNVAHVVVHQWFANLVSIAWWDDLWITEGIAAQMAFYYVERRYSSFQSEYFFRLATLTGVMQLDQKGQAHALSPPLKDLEQSVQIDGIFDQLEFMKSASLAQLVRGVCDDRYQGLLRDLVTKFAYRTITYDDYWQAVVKRLDGRYVRHIQTLLKDDKARGAGVFEKTSTRHTIPTIIDMIRTFAEFQGVPVLNVRVDEFSVGRSTLEAFHTAKKWSSLDGNIDPREHEDEIPPSQQLAIHTNRQFANVDRSKWRVTKLIMVATRRELMNSDFHISPAWLREGDEGGRQNYVKYSVNPDISTYYRTRYSDDLYERLMVAVRAKAFSPMDRLQLLDDANNLVQAQLIKPSIFTRLVEAYANEDHGAVLIELLVASKTLASIEGSEQAIEAVNRALLAYYNSRKFSITGQELFVEQRARQVITMALISRANQQVIDAALQAYDEAGAGNVALFLREPVYTAIVVSGSDRVIELLNKLSETKSYDETMRLVAALSLSKDKEVLMQLKGWLEATNLRPETIKPYQEVISASLKSQ